MWEACYLAMNCQVRSETGRKTAVSTDIQSDALAQLDTGRA